MIPGQTWPKEPWKHPVKSTGRGKNKQTAPDLSEIVSGEGGRVVRVEPYEGYQIEDGVLPRAVVCVNAMAGIADPLAYMAKVDEAIDCLRSGNMEGLRDAVFAVGEIRSPSKPKLKFDRLEDPERVLELARALVAVADEGGDWSGQLHDMVQELEKEAADGD